MDIRLDSYIKEKLDAIVANAGIFFARQLESIESVMPVS